MTFEGLSLEMNIVEWSNYNAIDSCRVQSNIGTFQIPLPPSNIKGISQVPLVLGRSIQNSFGFIGILETSWEFNLKNIVKQHLNQGLHNIL